MRQRIASSSGATSARSARPIASPEHTAEAAGDQPEKSFYVGQLSAFFLHPLVARVVFKERFVGFPEVTEALFSSIFRWDFYPKPSAGPCAPVPDHEGYDLPSSSAQSDPEPPLVRALMDVCPAFVQFKDIAFLRRFDLISYRLGFASLFLSHRERVFRLTPKMRLIALFEPRSR